MPLRMLSQAETYQDLVYYDRHRGFAVNLNVFVGSDDPKMDWYFSSETQANKKAKEVLKRIERLRNEGY